MTERTTSMPAALRRRREYAGPTLFSYGFRPFFLGGALWAALEVAKTVENATIVFVVCDRGDRYLSTGVFPA